MTKYKTLLVEIGTEELPPAQLTELENTFCANFASGLRTANLWLADDAAEDDANAISKTTSATSPKSNSKIESFATPRRLALKVINLPEKQPDTINYRQGPSITAAFDPQGKPTKAGLGFAKSCGVDIQQLEQKETANGIVLAYTAKQPGKTCQELIPQILQKALAELPIAKNMRWGSLSESFVRPVHWITLLFGKEVINTTLFAISADRYTHGHRFHCLKKLPIKHADDYVDCLENEGFVFPDSKKRKAIIQAAAQDAAANCGGSALISAQLLDVVTGLVEYPVILTGSFNDKFLTLPKEVLISVLEQHQKCFPIIDKHGKLLAKFIIVSNINSTKPQTIINGNECVMHARLADAQFHYQQDQQHSLANRIVQLKNVIFQQKLGSIYDKTTRIKDLAIVIAKKIGAQIEPVTQAAKLCKADLMTQMVGEFPELQGIMGYYYAQNDGETKEIATAIREHYLPRHAQDVLPASLPGVCLAIADRVDTLVGLFALGKAPTADKDPFGLRRQTLAVLRILIEKSLPLDLQTLFHESIRTYGTSISTKADFLEQLMNFCFERLRGYCLDKAIPAKTFAAVLARRPTDPFNFYCRLKAVQSFQTLAAAESLSAANKRVRNILLKSAEEAGLAKTGKIDRKLLIEPPEQALFAVLSSKEQEIAPLLAQADFTNTLKALAELKPAIDLFFDKVMVLTDDLKLRNNRLLLLNKLRQLFLEVADISLL